MNKQLSLGFVLLLLALVCCVVRAEGQPSPSPAAATGLQGTISLHNITGGPVRVGVPDSRPLADMTFVVQKGEETVASFTTDEQGKFRVSLPPGHYSVLRKDWKARVGFFGPFEVDVEAGQMKQVAWKCDTGMQ